MHRSEASEKLQGPKSSPDHNLTIDGYNKGKDSGNSEVEGKESHGGRNADTLKGHFPFFPFICDPGVGRRGWTTCFLGFSGTRGLGSTWFACVPSRLICSVGDDFTNSTGYAGFRTFQQSPVEFAEDLYTSSVVIEVLQSKQVLDPCLTFLDPKSGGKGVPGTELGLVVQCLEVVCVCVLSLSWELEAQKKGGFLRG